MTTVPPPLRAQNGLSGLSRGRAKSPSTSLQRYISTLVLVGTPSSLERAGWKGVRKEMGKGMNKEWGGTGRGGRRGMEKDRGKDEWGMGRGRERELGEQVGRWAGVDGGQGTHLSGCEHAV